MPKLNKNQQQAVEGAESKAFSALPEGRYLATLKDVKVMPGGENGPYWSWEYSDLIGLSGDVEVGKKAPGRQWVNTSLTEASAWKMKEVFDAHGYTVDSDTDEMVGEKVVLVISQNVIERGKRKGEIGNNVDRVVAPDEDDLAVADGALVGAGAGKSDQF